MSNNFFGFPNRHTPRRAKAKPTVTVDERVAEVAVCFRIIRIKWRARRRAPK